MICYLRSKRGWNIFEWLKSWQMTESAKKKQSWICIQFFVNKSRAYAVIGQSSTFLTDYTQNLHSYAVCWHKQPPDKKNIQFGHQVSKQLWKLWQTQFFGTEFRGGSDFFFIYGVKFLQQERVLWGWLAGPSPRKWNSYI